jgi:hypothetical protein
MNRIALLVLAVTSLALAALPAWSQATWEGPTGVFLNPLALDLAQGKSQASIHYLDLDDLGSLSSVGYTYGATKNWEVGYTRASLTVGGTNTDFDILHTKVIVLPFKGQVPQVAAGAIARDAHVGKTTYDVYLTATKIFPGKIPTLTSLTVRGTDGIGSGLFGKDDDFSFQAGAFLGWQVSPKLILGAEYYGQPAADDWFDIAARYVVGPSTFVDAGVARINDDLDAQWAAAVTAQW